MHLCTGCVPLCPELARLEVNALVFRPGAHRLFPAASIPLLLLHGTTVAQGLTPQVQRDTDVPVLALLRAANNA